MPVNYVVFDDLNLVVTRYVGYVNHVDVLNLFKSLQSQETDRLRLNAIADLTGADQLDFSPEALEYLSDRYARHLMRTAASQRTAIIATTDINFGIASTYAGFANRIGAEKTSVFREFAPAVTWLNLPSTAISLLHGKELTVQ